ncbi:MAG: sulfurtransferase [Spirochaetaceae bacterium]|nr:MAG: sulfurtransferase [Spirochaetaceae bacterium]
MRSILFSTRRSYGRTALLMVLSLALILATGCGAPRPGERDTEIITAAQALELLQSNPNAVLVDVRPGVEFNREHIQGAVSVSRADIVVNTPFPALLAPPEQIERNLGRRGISNQSLVIAYDDNNSMDSARLWWTLKVYGHHDVKVVSGGYNALLAAGAAVSSTAPSVTAATFRAQPADQSMLISATDVRRWVNEPDPAVVLIDNRSPDEFSEGSIPGAIHLDFIGNLFRDGTFRPARHIYIRHAGAGVDYNTQAILYCATSIRSAQAFLAMYNAGYRGMRIYDGAWVEWSANPMNPIFVPEQPGGRVRSADAS